MYLEHIMEMDKESIKNHLRAIKNLMLLSAVIHVIILVGETLISFDYERLNYFRIIELQVIFPGIEEGRLSYVVSMIVMTGVYLVFFTLSKFKPKLKKIAEISIEYTWNRILSNRM